MDQITNKEILEKLNQIQIDIKIIKERLPEEEELLDQVKDSLADAKAGRIKKVA